MAEYKLELEWDNGAASYDYVLTSNRWINTRTRKNFWGEIARGDSKWAARTAKHYGLTVPSPAKKAARL